MLIFSVAADSTASTNTAFIVTGASLVFEGEHFVISANSPVYLTEAEARAALVDGGKAAADVKAWNKDNGAPTSVSVAFGSLDASAGNYTVTYRVDAETEDRLAVEFRVLGDIVVEGGGYLLTASSPVHLSTTLAASMVDDGEQAAAVRAYNKVTGSSLVLSAELVSFVAKPYSLEVFSSSVVGSQAGAYLVRYRVDAYPSLTAEVLFVVDDNDLCVVGATHVVTGKSEVKLTVEEAALIADGGVKAGGIAAYGITDGLTTTVSVLSGAVGSEPGSYTVVYRVDNEPGAVISVTFIVARDGGTGGGNQGGSGSGTGSGSRPGTGTTSTGDPQALIALLVMSALLALAVTTLIRRRQNNL
jgi:hypothetical protein